MRPLDLNKFILHLLCRYTPSISVALRNMQPGVSPLFVLTFNIVTVSGKCFRQFHTWANE